jgi:hypothetical protein
VLAKLYDEVERLTAELEAARAKMHTRAAEVVRPCPRTMPLPLHSMQV